jgi:hypothetical protein
MQFTQAPKRAKSEGTYVVSKIDTIARNFLWDKVMLDGVLCTTHADYVAKINAMSPKDREKAAAYATQLSAARHARSVAKKAGNGKLG